MAFDRAYYEGKKAKLEERFLVLKDKTLARFIDSLEEIKTEFVSARNELMEELGEINAIIKEQTKAPKAEKPSKVTKPKKTKAPDETL